MSRRYYQKYFRSLPAKCQIPGNSLWEPGIAQKLKKAKKTQKGVQFQVQLGQKRAFLLLGHLPQPETILKSRRTGQYQRFLFFSGWGRIVRIGGPKIIFLSDRKCRKLICWGRFGGRKVRVIRLFLPKHYTIKNRDSTENVLLNWVFEVIFGVWGFNRRVLSVWG